MAISASSPLLSITEIALSMLSSNTHPIWLVVHRGYRCWVADWIQKLIEWGTSSQEKDNVLSFAD